MAPVRSQAMTTGRGDEQGQAARPGSPARRLAAVVGAAPPLVVDGALAAVVAVVQVAGAAADAALDGEPRLTPTAIALLVVSAAPLVPRRVHPVAALCVTGSASALYGIRPYPDPFLQIPLLIILFTVAARCPRRTTVVVGLVGVVAALVTMVLSRDSGADDYYSTYLTVALALVLGDGQRTRSERLAALEQRADELQRRLEAEADQAAAEERARIARDMHDVVAHHVSMVVVQAEAGAAIGDDAAAARFDAIAATGRDALVDLRRILGVLRDDQPAATAPQPGLDRIEALVAEVRDAGLPVDLRIEGERTVVPPGVDLSAYRIVQEALTNVARHAGGAPAVVTIRYGRSTVDVEVVDQGPGTAGDHGGDSPGRGLLGIRERVAMCGGTMRSGQQPDGGFAVSAELPIGPGAP